MRAWSRILATVMTIGVAQAAAAQGARTPAPLRVGAAKVDVTPSVGELPKNSQGVLDRLFARAIVIDNAGTSAALVTVDAGGIPDAVWQAVTREVEKELGIPAVRVLLTATHTHSAGGPRGPDYARKIVDSVRQAKQRLAPARVGYGTGESFINVNRQIIDPKTHRWWEGPNREGPSDKTVAVLAFETLTGAPIAVYYNYAVHAVLAGQLDQVSADIPGAASRYIEESFGDAVVALWSSGAAGDQNPIYYQQTYDLREIRIKEYATRGIDISNAMPPGGEGLNRSDPAVARLMNQQRQMVASMGQFLGEEVLYVMRGIERKETAALLYGASTTVQCPGRERTDQGRAGVGGTYKEGPPVEIQLGLLRIGEVMIGAVNAEVFNPIAQRLKRESPFKATMMTTLTNGSARSGYIPDDASFGKYTFEVLSSRLQPGCAESSIVDGILALIEGSRGAGQSVKVETGLVEGTIEDGLRVYRGIPYAAPPVGDLRWRAPQPAAKWEGVRAATEYGRACMQTNAAIAALPPPSEDCLFVNVWTPATRPAERLPVMVWIHGGGFTAGTPAEQLYHAEWLAKKGVVVVSVGYRLGVFGFLAHPELSAENDHRGSGNYGLLDMIAGLQWVQRNIAAFGGDPGQVTVFGESAGAIAVSQLCVSPLAKGLFHRAISESGGSFGPVGAGGGAGENMLSLASAEQAGAAWAQSLGAARISDLRKLAADKLQEASRGKRGLAWPIADGRVIPDDQYRLYEAGKYHDVPVLIGYNSDEGATFGVPPSQAAYVDGVRQRYGPFADKLLAAYPGGDTPTAKKTARDLTRDTAFGWHTWTWARLQKKTGKSNVFLYYFDEHPEYPAASPREGFGAAHASELPYLFRQLREHGRPPATPQDEAMSELLRTYWTNFAKTGDPNMAGLPAWPAFTSSDARMLHIGSNRTSAGPIVSEGGLKVLDEYFAWRRSSLQR